MELRHLRYFLAVAEELNFTRAAKRLHISQPPLTQQIKALEAEMGVELFDRSAYRIELTDAGRLFAAEAARIMGELRDAVQMAQRAADGTAGQLRIGFTESASFNPLVTASLRRFRAQYPGIAVSLEEHPSIELTAALREERLDAAFVRPPVRAEPAISFDLLEEEELFAAVPAGHALAKRRRIDIRDLRQETFILYPRAVRPGLADAIVAACEAAGYTPNVGQYAPQLSSTINLVAASLGVSIVPRSMQGLQPHLVAYIRLRERPISAQLGIAYRSRHRTPIVQNFVAVTRRSFTSA